MESRNQPFFERGEFFRLFVLFLPLAGVALFNCLFLFSERLFLSRVSQAALEAAVNATYVCQLFQLSSASLTSMAQVFVGRWIGAKQFSTIGRGIWQFIWFSLLSMLVSIPGSLLYGWWYFSGTEIEDVARNYFYILTASNFLYPLSAALSSFFWGQGKTRFVLMVSLGEQIAKTVISYFLIFGMDPWIPSFGILGGVISSFSVSIIFCVVLGFRFLGKKERERFHTNEWKLIPSLFWHCVQPGLFRAFNRISSILSWVGIARLMVLKGGNYLLILSLGGSLSIFLPFVFEAVYQAQTIVLSQHIGAKRYFLLPKTIQSGSLLVFCSILLIGIPFLTFPSTVFAWSFPKIVLDPLSIQLLFLGMWAWFAYFTYCAIPISYILSFKDTQFYFILGGLTALTDYLLMYFFIETLHLPANLFWLTLAVVQATSTVPIYFWRMKTLHKRVLIT